MLLVELSHMEMERGLMNERNYLFLIFFSREGVGFKEQGGGRWDLHPGPLIPWTTTLVFRPRSHWQFICSCMYDYFLVWNKVKKDMSAIIGTRVEKFSAMWLCHFLPSPFFDL